MYKSYIVIIGAIAALLLLSLYAKSGQDEYLVHRFDKIRLSSTFYGEGSAIGDLNGNGYPDVTCGPYWYEGPDFENRRAFYEPEAFDPLQYSDNFIMEVDDVNDDGNNDILVVGHPGREAFWYENPGTGEEGWQRHLIHSSVENESPIFGDVTADGRKELIFHTGGYLGYAVSDPDHPSRAWSFRRVSEPGSWQRYNHGLGIGDVNGNGRPDFMMKEGWWENPGPGGGGSPWPYHPVDFGPGGAQMHAYDVDGDGLNDVITTLEAHGWGLAWYRQVRTEGTTAFDQQVIMGESRDDNPYGVRFSQPHTLVLADVDGNGLQDLISGKRYWAHGPEGDPEPNAPAVVYWFKLDRSTDGQVTYIPYLVDDDSGAGVGFASGDLTGNGYADIVTCNKKGGFVFLNRPESVSRTEWQDRQPEVK